MAHLGDIEYFLELMRSLSPAWLLLAVLVQAGTVLARREWRFTPEVAR